MSDRLKGCTVVFEQDIREDDAEALLNAMRMLKGVLSVTPQLSVPEDHFAEMRVRREWEAKIWKLLHPES